MMRHHLHMPSYFLGTFTEYPKVSLAFEIDKQGRPVNIEVGKSLCPSLDREAVRLLKSGPIWQGSAKVGQVDIWFK